jgi:hypothetical protein
MIAPRPITPPMSSGINAPTGAELPSRNGVVGTSSPYR